MPLYGSGRIAAATRFARLVKGEKRGIKIKSIIAALRLFCHGGKAGMAEIAMVFGCPNGVRKPA